MSLGSPGSKGPDQNSGIAVEGFLELRQSAGLIDRAAARIAALRARMVEQGEWETAAPELKAAIEDVALSASGDGDEAPLGEDAASPAQAKRFTIRQHVATEIDRLPDAMLPRYLTYRYRWETWPDNHTVGAYPPCVQLEPTSICNFRCVFCYQTDASFSAKNSPHMGTMSVDLFKRAIDEIEGEVEAVTLASRGEPLAARGLPEMLAYMRGKFLASKMNTNASLLDERRAHLLLEADLQTLVFSADAAVEPLYSKLRVGGTLEKTRKNIELFREIQAKHYPESNTVTRVSGVKVSDDQDSDDMEKAWGGLVDQVAFVTYDPYMEAYDAPSNGIDTPCSDLWRRMFVWWDGRLSPCDADYKSMMVPERFPERSISEIWNGERYQELRGNHLAGRRANERPCRGCVLY